MSDKKPKSSLSDEQEAREAQLKESREQSLAARVTRQQDTEGKAKTAQAAALAEMKQPKQARGIGK